MDINGLGPPPKPPQINMFTGLEETFQFVLNEESLFINMTSIHTSILVTIQCTHAVLIIFHLSYKLAQLPNSQHL